MEHLDQELHFSKAVNDWNTCSSNVQSDVCPHNCIDRTCDDPANNELRCTYGCTDGHWGAKCINDCPSYCITCDQVFLKSNECFECQDGYYFTEADRTCALSCPDGCRTCSSSTNCTSCSSGYYTINTECRACPSRCTECTSDSQCTACIAYATGVVCENCVDGKYGTSCAIDCRDQCKSCKSYNDCPTCTDGFYNTDTITNCALDSPPCPSTCETCVSETECTKCNNKYYNTDTERNCSNMCPAHCAVCESATSCSVCEANFEGTVCQACVTGKFGPNCELSCSSNCIGETCDKQTGNCLNGCKQDYSGDKCCIPSEYCNVCFSNTICKTCVKGRHGYLCEDACADNCDGLGCHKDDGSCYKCQDPYYGSKCENMCPASCVPSATDNRCSFSTGQCTGECLPGYFGEKCDKECTTNCFNNTCSKTGTSCLKGCVPGFKGVGCSEADEDDSTTDTLTIVGISVGSLAGIAIVILLVSILVKYRRPKQGNQQGGHDEPQLEMTTQDEYATIAASDVSNIDGDYEIAKSPTEPEVRETSVDKY